MACLGTVFSRIIGAIPAELLNIGQGYCTMAEALPGAADSCGG